MPRRPGRAVALLLLTVLVAGQGCYTYHATTIPDLARNEEIRVSLGDAEYRRVAPGGVMSGPRRIEGRFGGMRADSVILSVWIGEAYVGTPFASAYQDIMIPRQDVIAVENRQLSRGRTALVAAGVLGVVAVLIDSIGLVEVFGNGSGGEPPIPPDGEDAVLGY